MGLGQVETDARRAPADLDAASAARADIRAGETTWGPAAAWCAAISRPLPSCALPTSSSVKTVLVDGKALKEDFKLKADLAGPRRAVEASRDYLVGKFGEPEPGWLVRAAVS